MYTYIHSKHALSCNEPTWVNFIRVATSTPCGSSEGSALRGYPSQNQ